MELYIVLWSGLDYGEVIRGIYTNEMQAIAGMRDLSRTILRDSIQYCEGKCLSRTKPDEVSEFLGRMSGYHIYRYEERDGEYIWDEEYK